MQIVDRLSAQSTVCVAFRLNSGCDALEAVVVATAEEFCIFDSQYHPSNELAMVAAKLLGGAKGTKLVFGALHAMRAVRCARWCRNCN